MRTVLPALAIVTTLFSTGCGRSGEPAGNAGQQAATPQPAWTMTVQAVDVPAGPHSLAPFITTSDGAAVLSWITQNDRTATLNYATRESAGWSTPRTVRSGTDWFVSWADTPSVLRLSNGTLVANWYRNTNIELEAYDLWMSYSRDEGKSWAAPFMPHHDRTKTQHGFASLFPRAEGGIGLVYLDGRENETNAEHPEDAAIMLRYAAFDAGWKQIADDTVNLRVCDCCQTSVAATSDGVIAAFRDRSETEIRDIGVVRLENGKWSEPTTVHDDKWEIDSCPVNGPAISARGRTVAAAWFTAKNNQGQAFAAFSSDGGRTWGAPIRLDEGRSTGHVDVEMLDDGSAVASWVEFADQRAHFRIRRVQPDGGRSAAIEVAGTGPGRVSGYPRMARQGNELLFSWTESMGSDEDPEAPRQIKGAVAQLPK